ncbi:MAG: hypothetical protein KF773_31045 [Deltaproteobacteria bacterium]|nr:hypothetical protein [Deltaproteobacteria bacterium]MCW5803632.1 hypothetical protein [Deltaproteobacteria bacterium]
MKLRVDAELASELAMYDPLAGAELVLVPGDESFLQIDAARYEEARARAEAIVATVDDAGDVEIEPPPGVFAALACVKKMLAANQPTGFFDIAPQYLSLSGIVNIDPREPRLRFARAAWHGIKRAGDVWTVAGRVRGRGGKPVPGVLVDIFDADVVRHDEIGRGMTDEVGRFRVEYREHNFRRGDLVYGPDLFFRVSTPLGAELLRERAMKGHLPGRANVEVVAVIELQIESDPAP